MLDALMRGSFFGRALDRAREDVEEGFVEGAPRRRYLLDDALAFGARPDHRLNAAQLTFDALQAGDHLTFLGDVRISLITALTIPVSILFAFGLMVATGNSANLISIGAIDFGILAEAAVVVVENIHRRLAGRRTGVPGSHTDDGGLKNSRGSAGGSLPSSRACSR